MSANPSWLTPENVNTANTMAKNPLVQKMAKDVAADAAKNPEPYLKAANTANSWQSPPPPPPPPARDVEAARPSTSGQSSEVTAASLGVDEEELKFMKRYYMILRFSYMATSINMAIMACLKVQKLGNGSKAVPDFFLCGYVFAFAVMIWYLTYFVTIR